MKRSTQFLLIAVLSCFSIIALQAQTKTGKNTSALIAADVAFLKKNKTQPGIVELSSGLQYRVIKMGTGPKPMKFGRIKYNFTVRLLNGKIIGSNGNKPENILFKDAMPGVKEAISMMPVGSKWDLYLPVAIVDKGMVRTIKGADGRGLQCTIELLDVN